MVAAFTMFLGITFPFFGGLLGFFGGFAFAPTTYFVSSTITLSTSVWINRNWNWIEILFCKTYGNPNKAFTPQ